MTLTSLDRVSDVNFIALQATMQLKAANKTALTLYPQRRLYNGWQDQPNTEVAIHSTLIEDVYIQLAGMEPDSKFAAFEVKINPLISWIWLGGIVVTIGAIFCVLPRLLPKVKHVAVAERTSHVKSEPIAGKTVETAS